MNKLKQIILRMLSAVPKSELEDAQREFANYRKSKQHYEDRFHLLQIRYRIMREPEQNLVTDCLFHGKVSRNDEGILDRKYVPLYRIHSYQGYFKIRADNPDNEMRIYRQHESEKFPVHIGTIIPATIQKAGSTPRLIAAALRMLSTEEVEMQRHLYDEKSEEKQTTPLR